MANHDAEVLHATRIRLRETATAIAAVVAEDLATYPERELQRRFVESERGDTLTDAQIAELRRGSRDLGQSFASEIKQKLADDAPWHTLLAEDAAVPEDRKSLRGIPAVWAIVSAIDARVEQLAAAMGLQGDHRTPAGYQAPARFISHQHLPTLVEKYFREIGELRKLGDLALVQDAEGRRRSRAERWAGAGE